MTPGNRAALETLQMRLNHVISTADLLEQAMPEVQHRDVLAGLGNTLAELTDRLDAIITPRAIGGAS